MLSFPHSDMAPACGELVDVSDSGFRASHAGLTLRSGDYVNFEAPDRHGLARVVWTRISEKNRESGFLIVHAIDARQRT